MSTTDGTPIPILRISEDMTEEICPDIYSSVSSTHEEGENDGTDIVLTTMPLSTSPMQRFVPPKSIPKIIFWLVLAYV